MRSQTLAILNTGFITSVGLTSDSSCAAIRAKLSNPTQTAYIDSNGEWINAHTVPLFEVRGRSKLVRMAAKVIEECLAAIPRREWSSIPILLCVAERERAGRASNIEEGLLAEIEQDLGVQFDERSAIFPNGRVSVCKALVCARQLLAETYCASALIVATDSLLTWPTLSMLDLSGRLLTQKNSDGFIPGEGAAALLIGAGEQKPGLQCVGLGLATEHTNMDAGQPFRGDGLTSAIKLAFGEAGCEMHEVDFRVTDLSGAQYYFKEAALALSRVLRKRKERMELWHPAECIGETGAVSGVATIIVAEAACRKLYAPGDTVLCHSGTDSGDRCAMIFRFGAY